MSPDSDRVILEVKNLRVTFDTPAGVVRAVNGVSYRLLAGQALGIVGESGCGKTVSVNAVMRLLPPSGKVAGGEVVFDGKDVLNMKERAFIDIRGKEMSMIFQDPMTSLNPVYTIGNQIMETLKRHLELSAPERRKRTEELLKMVGIPDPAGQADRYPHEFSGGMRQRAMIAMALSCDPKLLIADEPTTALDVTIQAQILELMQELRRRVNTSIIMITHDLGIVSTICDYVLVMYAGVIVEQGTVDEIFYESAHPYTIGLLGCLPSMMDEERKPLSAIPGTPVDLLQLPAGCPYAARCPHCMRICLDWAPGETRHSETHASHCWLHSGKGARL